MPAIPDVKAPYTVKPLHIVLTVLFGAFCLYSGFTTPDLNNWLLENLLTLSLIIFLVAFYNIFRFTNLSYTLIFLFLLLHVYGSQYQYDQNPFGEWLRERFDLSRNHYDRFVHLGFGLLLAYPMHDLFTRGFKIKWPYNYFLPVEITLSLSALYELLEWFVADIVFNENEQGMAFLGMQGDIWDAQKDMGLAFAGAAFTMTLTYLLHKRSR
ncbi:DUF2238 domain-containing protein [Pontibacter sp. 13R65]|uniref:DUF2238 domain-containing protein n=1 Tax=Pontibacter sp. 13R65 TaxID=3127458 RepID=UPI00301D7AAC